MQEQKLHQLLPIKTKLSKSSKLSKNLNLLQISERGEVKLNSNEALEPDVIQQILDYSYLRANAYEQAQKQIEQAYNLQAVIIGLMLSLSLFTITFTVSRTLKNTHTKAQINVVSITV
ncbi:MAG: hypothetical protein ACYT04_38110 [Nostoc sp.]